MMRLLSLSLAFLLAANAAEACTPPIPPHIRFNTHSAEISAERVAALRQLAAPVKVHSPKCSSFELRSFIDPLENGDLVVGRLEAIEKILLIEGAMGSQINMKVERGTTNNAMLRTVVVTWRWAPGQWRCDPASRNPSPVSAACQTAYARCYFVVADGTICNPHNVPDPNPETYSVIQ
jgi:hypothetical protein